MAATKLRIYQDALRLLGDARLSLVTDDVESRYALDDSWDESVAFVLGQAPWRFALKTASLVSNGSAISGFSSGFAYPADWLRTHSIFLSQTDGRECPLDLREQGINILTNAGVAPVIRYVSNTFVDPTVSTGWPEHFAQCVAAYLAFLVAERVTGDRGAPATMSKLFASLLPEATAIDAVPESRWLPHQRNPAYLRGVRHVLRLGYWRFALKDATISASAGSPALGFQHSYALPADWLRTHKLFITSGSSDSRESPIDIREQGGIWSTNGTSFYARYVSSTLGLDSTQWPEPFQQAVLSFLEFEASDEYERASGNRGDPKAAPSKAAVWEEQLAAALAGYSEPEWPWLAPSLDGRLHRGTRYVLRQRGWRFAMKSATISATSGTPAPGYTFSFAIPADWLRTWSAFVLASSGGRENPVDFREQAGFWSTNSATFVARYISNIGFDSTGWPESFSQAVLAYVQFLVSDEKERDAAEKTFLAALQLAPDVDAAAEDAWLTYQLTGQMHHAAREVLQAGDWRFAIKTAAAVSGGTPAPGYSNGFAQPSDWLRTSAAFVTSGARECPFDLREQDTHWSANVAAFTVRYVSTAGLDATLWPEPFTQAVYALLTGEPAPSDKGSRAPLWLDLVAEGLQSHGLPANPWLGAQLDGTYQRVARAMVDQGFWRFAMVTGQTGTVAGGAGGFGRQAAIPADASRTRSLYVLTTAAAPTGAGERRPFKIREHGALWYTNELNFYAEYVSLNKAMDSTLWPDHYTRGVLRAIHFDRATRDDDKDQRDDLGIYKDALAEIMDSESVEDDPWLEYQLDGSFDTGSRAVLSRGYWWWGLKSLDIDSSTQESLSPQAGFPYRYALPSDWLRTHSLFVAWDGHECPINIRETAQDWSTDAAAWTARYVSTDVLDAKTWPEQVAAAVLAYLEWRAEPLPTGDKEPPQKAQIAGAEFQRLLADALTAYSLDEDPWLRFQLDGRYASAVKMVLEKARWRFAVKTVTLTDPNNLTGSAGGVAGDPNAFSDGSVSPGYSCRMPKPLDWQRTLRVYYSYRDGLGASWIDPDYRDELGAIHVNYNPVQMRYVSRLGLDSTQWPMNFREAVMAWLEYSEIAKDPKMTAAAGRKLDFFRLQCKEAETLDDERDMPRVENVGRFVRARGGRGSYTGNSQDWWPR